MSILKDTATYWNGDECADFSYSHFMKTADILREDLSDLSIAVNDASVLDLGCGTGRVPLMYKPSRYVGVEQSEKMIDRAREVLRDRAEVELHHELIHEFETNEHFDTLLLIDVLPHLDEIGCEATLKHVLREFDADTYVIRLFVALKGETIHYVSGNWGYLSISYTPKDIENRLLPMAQVYDADASFVIKRNTSPSVADGYIVVKK